MASKDEVPASLEGTRILVSGLKIDPSGRPVKFPRVGMVFQFSVKRRGDGTIEEATNPQETPLRPYSFLEVGDKIIGKELWGFASRPFKLGDIRVGEAGRSGSHPGQDVTCRGTCFLELINGWRGNPLPSHPRESLMAET
jgi:hypothetical protein